MSEPLFKVGELVGLVSVTWPEYNGQYHVRQVLYRNETYMDKFYGALLFITESDYAYILDGINEPHPSGREFRWKESALRKIHKVSDYSFDSLLTSLKNTSKMTSLA